MITPHRKRRTRRPAPPLQSFDALLIGAGMKPGPFIRALKRDLAGTADPVRAANNLHRFLTSGFPTTILRDFRDHPVLQQIALELFAQSQYLADVLVRDPALFRWLTTTTALKKTKSAADLREEAHSSVNLFSRLDRKLDSLKRFHRREILRIGARDILREADVVTITRELSDLADSVVEAVVQLGQRELALRTGATFMSTLAVIGLGKLGGQELNFSSDIDLLFVYDRDAEFDAPQERIRTYHEYYNRLSEFVVRKLSEFSGEGHLYRVDMRLRPEGAAGALALSVPGSLQYYEIRGETWERQMLVKARPLAGNMQTGKEWLDSVRPFVYPRTFISSPLEEIARMKVRIEEKSGDRDNLKLGEGGIRDIEFIVQGLQLLNGGKNTALREPNTLRALEQLASDAKLPRKDCRTLTEAYKFFRTVEHRLQLLHGAQTHSLPATKTESEILARRLSFSGGRPFTRTVETYRRSVRAIFSRIFLAPVRKGKLRRPQGRAVRYIDEAAGAVHLTRFREAIHSQNEPARFESLPHLVRQTGSADWTLESLAILADALPIRRALGQAWKNEELARLLVLIAARSRGTMELLAREPLLFETFIGQPDEIFRKDRGWEFLKIHDLQKYKTYNEHKTLLAFLAGQETFPGMLTRLSDLADELLIDVCSEIPRGKDIGLVALGKLGGREITFGSDLDLIVVYDKHSLDTAEAERTAGALRERFAGAGLFEIDFQLRPEGKNAPLAVEIGYYREYLQSRASFWERQSLVKARVVCAPSGLKEHIVSLVKESAYGNPLPPDWTGQMMRMRERMEQERSGPNGANLKTVNGGLVDLEFTLQALQLRFGREDQHLRDPNTYSAIESLRKSGIRGGLNMEEFEKSITFLRMLETFIRLNFVSGEFALPSDPVRLQAAAASVGKPSGAALKKALADVLRRNRKAFLRALRLCSK